MKKAYFVVCGCLLTLMLLWVFMTNQPNLSQIPRENWTKWRSVSYDPFVEDASSKEYLSEEEALKFEPLTNVQNIVSMNQSTVKILGITDIFSVGDKILISITLKEENGKRRTRGGDKLFARIFNTTYDAYAPGYVIDHDNGTYTAEVPAIWPGRSIISIYLAYPREDIRVMYATMRENFTTRHILGRYESGEAKEEVLCQPAREYFTHFEDVCNFTLSNGGMSWYCERPKNKQLLCKDWTSVKTEDLPKFFLQTDAERLTFRRRRGEKNMTVFIEGTLHPRDELPDCSSVPKRKTWVQHKPSGFFYEGRWHLNFCKLPREDTYGECLKGKHFLIFGDSTSRQWYEYMRDHLNCTQVTEKWTAKAWHKRSMGISRAMNFSATMIPHPHPFYPGNKWANKRFTNQYIAAYFDGIVDNSKVVIVIHMFSHIIHYRNEIFQDRMKAISRSVRNLLEGNKNVLILVKGPHTFNSILTYKYYMYRAILKEEFKELYDRIVFMEQGDMTIAKKNEEVHPVIDIVKEAIRQLIGYIC